MTLLAGLTIIMLDFHVASTISLFLSYRANTQRQTTDRQTDRQTARQMDRQTN